MVTRRQGPFVPTPRHAGSVPTDERCPMRLARVISTKMLQRASWTHIREPMAERRTNISATEAPWSCGWPARPASVAKLSQSRIGGRAIRHADIRWPRDFLLQEQGRVVVLDLTIRPSGGAHLDAVLATASRFQHCRAADSAASWTEQERVLRCVYRLFRPEGGDGRNSFGV
jgi:hypothetical protein